MYVFIRSLSTMSLSNEHNNKCFIENYNCHLLVDKLILGQNFFISWFTNPPTVIFWKVEKKKKIYFKNYFFILSADSKLFV